MSVEIQHLNIGTAIILAIVRADGTPEPLQGASLKQIKLEKPKSTGNPRIVLTKTASFPDGEDGSEGRIQYISIVDDLTPLGDWLVQGYIEEGASVKFHTSKEPFTVVRNVGEKL